MVSKWEMFGHGSALPAWLGLGAAWGACWWLASFFARWSTTGLSRAAVGAIGLELIAIGVVLLVAFTGGLAGDEATPRSAFTEARRVLFAAPWIGPTVLLAQARSPMALVAGLFFFGSASALVGDGEVLEDGRFWRSLLAAVALQMVVVLFALRLVVVALVVFGVGLLTLAYLVRKRQVARPWRRAVSVALALLVTWVLLLPKSPPVGDGERGVAEAKAAATVDKAGKGSGGVEAGDAHTGIILWPKRKKNIVRIPPPAAYPRAGISVPADMPVEIPFNGVYWLFQSPWREPPPGSPIERGTPIDFHFRSNDLSSALVLEARQSLPASVSMRGLSAIRLVLQSEDQFPNAAFAELILSSSRSPMLGVSLGKYPLENPSLVYQVPMQALIDRFDGLIVRCTHVRAEAHIATRIAVEKFILVRR